MIARTLAEEAVLDPERGGDVAQCARRVCVVAHERKRRRGTLDHKTELEAFALVGVFAVLDDHPDGEAP